MIFALFPIQSKVFDPDLAQIHMVLDRMEGDAFHRFLDKMVEERQWAFLWSLFQAFPQSVVSCWALHVLEQAGRVYQDGPFTILLAPEGGIPSDEVN